MDKVNNKYGIEMYYYIDEQENRIIICDSNTNYFNDLTLEEEDYNTNFKSLIETLENTTLKEMCVFFNHNLYNNIEELAKDNEIADYEDCELLENEYVNVFNVGDKTFYTWAWC